MIFHIVKRRNFVQVDKLILNDPRLSFKAKGLLVYLLGKPAIWRVNIKQLRQASTDGETAIYSGLKELRKFGYAELKVLYDNKSKQVRGTGWVIYETSQIPHDPGFRSRRKRESLVSALYSNNVKSSNNVCPESEDSGRTVGFLGLSEEYSQFVKDCAHTLEDFIRKSRKLNRKFNRSKWYKAFAGLLNDLDNNRKRLRRVLRIYTNLEHDEYTPVVESGEAFRNKFTKIEAWIKRRRVITEDEGGNILIEWVGKKKKKK